MLPFFISVEKPRKELKDIIEAVFCEFERIGNVKIPRIHIGSNWNDKEFGSVSWYVNQAYNHSRKQALTFRFWELFENEPWQKQEPHYELMILITDLYSPGTNFVFGEIDRKFPSME